MKNKLMHMLQSSKHDPGKRIQIEWSPELESLFSDPLDGINKKDKNAKDKKAELTSAPKSPKTS